MRSELDLWRQAADQLTVDGFIAWLAARQHGVVAAWQLVACKVSREEIKTRLGGPRIFRIHRGVFAVGHSKLTPEGRLMAAVLRSGEGAVLSAGSAAYDYRIFKAFPEKIEVTVPAVRDKPEGVPFKTFTATFLPGETTVRNGIPVTSYARTFFDLAATRREDSLKLAFEHVERHPRELRNIARMIDDHAGERGVKALRKVLANYARHTGVSRSTLELEFVAWLTKRGISLPELNAHLPIGDEVFLPDCLWRAAKLIVELDTWDFHGFPAARERDNRRDRVLDLAGYAVFRVMPADLVGDRGDELAAQIEQKLARAGVQNRELGVAMV
jgi:very-short-patch-repair endonuclease